jgi:DNA invertase Pin-like site-specific DNA recombinase
MSERAALYARVSKGSPADCETQMGPMRAFALARHWAIVAEAREVAPARGRRPEWERMLAAGREGYFSVLVVWKLDRAFRSVLEALRVTESLAHDGIAFVAVTQPIDTTGPAGKLLFTVLAAVAEIERDLIRERTLAGMARARASGKRIGRPKGSRDRRRRRIAIRGRAV